MAGLGKSGVRRLKQTRMGLWTAVVGTVAVFMALLAACSQAAAPEPAPEPVVTPAEAPLTVLIGSSDLAVGPNRLFFGVLDGTSGPVRTPEVKATLVYLEDDTGQSPISKTARFVEWPSGRAGVYVMEATFDRAGRWGAIVQVPGEDGTTRDAQAGFIVKEQSSSPGIGQLAPPSQSKTAANVTDLAQITSSSVPDPDLYVITIADAEASNMPTVVTFSSPAFCSTATCGPQVEVVAALKDRYRGQANFIHVEMYDNPAEMKGDPSTIRLSPVVAEWGLLSDPFTFVLDAKGLVAAKFEGFVTEEELEASFKQILKP